MSWVNNNILNQGGAPAILEGVFSALPTAGVPGRIYISSDTFAIYRDTGIGWDLIGGPGIGTVTGNGAPLQLALWNGTQVLKGDTGITFNNTTKAITAGGFVVTGGTSEQFQKADGSLDSTVYVNVSGAQTITGQKTFTQQLFSNEILVVGVNGSITSNRIQIQPSTTDSYIEYLVPGGSTSLWTLLKDNINNFSINRYDISGTKLDVPIGINFSTGNVVIANTITAASLIKSGSSDSFILLGGGGTVATSSFAPATGGSYLPLAGGTLTGGLIGSGASSLSWHGSIVSDSNVSALGNNSVFGVNSVTGFPLTINANSAQQGLKLVGTSDNSYIQFFKSDGTTYQGYLSGQGTNVILGVASGDVLTINSTKVAAFSSRLNVNGATDNSSYQLNVTGAGNFSSLVNASNIYTSGYSGINFAGYTSVMLAVKGASITSADSAFIAYDSTGTTVLLQARNDGVITAGIRVNVNGATDNSLFALNVSGTINGSSPSFTGNTYTVTGNLSKQFYHVFTGAVGQTLTAPTPSGNNSQYLIVNNSANVLTVAAFSGTNIITTIGTTSATITLAANARTLLVADGNNKYYQAF